MDKHLFLIRHSTPDIDYATPSNQWKLNAKGTKRAQLLARQLCSNPIDVIVSSPEPKALETAKIITSYRNLVPSVHSKLSEHDRTNAPVMSESKFKDSIISFFENPNELTFGNETADEAGGRFDETIKEILRNYPDETIVIVSHGTVMALFIAECLNKDPVRIWRDMPMPVAYVFSRPELELQSIIRIAEDEI